LIWLIGSGVVLYWSLSEQRKAEIKRTPALLDEETKPQFELFEIKVSVMWDSLGSEKHLELMTTKIAEKSEGEG